MLQEIHRRDLAEKVRKFQADGKLRIFFFFFRVFLFICHTIKLLKDAKRKKKNVGRDGEEA